jgi:hypothetical protein
MKDTSNKNFPKALSWEEFQRKSKEIANRHARAFVDGLNSSVNSESQSQTEKKSLPPRKQS